MTDLNQYLRRADVEALLEGKIEDLDRRIAAQTTVIEQRTSPEAVVRSAVDTRRDARARREAIAAVRAHLGMCQQFNYRTFRDYDGPGTKHHALVDASKDRVPLTPEQDRSDADLAA